MKKYLIRLWVGYGKFERAQKESEKYVTLRIIETTEKDEDSNLNIYNDGVCYISCDEYEIIGSQSGDEWNEVVSLKFDGATLTIIPKGENYIMSFPIEIDD